MSNELEAMARIGEIRRLEKTPLTLQIVIHYYCTPGDYPESQACTENIKMLVEIGMLTNTHDDSQKFRINSEMAEVYLDKILSIPFPIAKYIIKENV